MFHTFYNRAPNKPLRYLKHTPKLLLIFSWQIPYFSNNLYFFMFLASYILFSIAPNPLQVISYLSPNLLPIHLSWGYIQWDLQKHFGVEGAEIDDRGIKLLSYFLYSKWSVHQDQVISSKPFLNWRRTKYFHLVKTTGLPKSCEFSKNVVDTI